MTKRILVATLLLLSLLWGKNKAGDADGSDWKEYSQTSVITSKAVNGYQFKTGQRRMPGT